MTERKPFGSSFESWIDKQVREATERGDFDDLPGAGKPLRGLDRPLDENWWLKDYLHREGMSAEAFLPTPLRLRKEIERLPDTVRDLPTEPMVRDVVSELNLRIADWLRAPSGPHLPVAPVNTDSVVEQWRANRPVRTPPPDRPARQVRRARWWRRRPKA